LCARLAALRIRAGDVATARSELREALARFDAERHTIVDMWRAAALRPIAEAHHLLGDTTTALEIYTRAVEAGVENPNSRPRADDLCATCLSLALHDVAPDSLLLDRLTEICNDLGDPW
jgi:hypothetical protein